jgi:hypothetical protein
MLALGDNDDHGDGPLTDGHGDGTAALVALGSEDLVVVVA